jgi:hypothetical protein
MRLRVIVSWAGRRLPELKSQCHQKNPKTKQKTNKQTKTKTNSLPTKMSPGRLFHWSILLQSSSNYSMK